MLPHITLAGLHVSSACAAAAVLAHASGRTIDLNGVLLAFEAPHDGHPRVLAFAGPDDFCEHYLAIGQDDVIFEAITARELAALASFGASTPETIHDDAARHDTVDDPHLAGIIDLATRYGWDTPLYRADYLAGPRPYQPEPIDKFMAVAAFAAYDLAHWHLIPAARMPRSARNEWLKRAHTQTVN